MSESPTGTSERAMVHVANGYGARTREPFVTLRVKEEFVNLTPEDAREVALNLIEATEAAMGDALIMRFAERNLGVNDEQAAQLLVMFRKLREEGRKQ
jgi:hypothetical protein